MPENSDHDNEPDDHDHLHLADVGNGPIDAPTVFIVGALGPELFRRQEQ